MKIVLISHSASLTGAPILLANIAEQLHEAKYSRQFIVADDGPLIERLKKIGPTVIEPLYPDNELKYWREITRVKRRLGLLREMKPDLVIANTIQSAKWLLYARMLGIPTLTYVLELSMGFSTLTRVEHLIVRRFSNHFLAVSEAVKQYLIQSHGIAQSKIDVLRPGIYTDRFVSSTAPEDAKRALGLGDYAVIGSVGRISHMKGTDLFVELALELKRSAFAAKPFKFLLVATTQEREFYQRFTAMLDQYGLSDDFLVVEDVLDVAPYLFAMDVYVSTAREDPLPLVVIEAMAASKPVVAFAVGGIPEAITPGCGILINGIDIGAMKREILQLISHPEERQKIGTAARVRATGEFDIAGSVSRIEVIIDRMLR